jgi:methionine-rich copper-binding protein CopC
MSRFRVLAAGVAVAVFAVLSAAAPASAHDELLSSSPAPGDALTAAPESVSLQFSADVLTMGAVVVIYDAEGVDWIASEPVLAGSTVTAQVRPGMPEAGYELRWRVVSSDGHPIAGVIPFTIGDADPLARDSGDETDAAADDTGARSSSAESQASQENGVVRAVLVGAGGAVVAIAVFVLIRFLLRRRGAPAGTGNPDR